MLQEQVVLVHFFFFSSRRRHTRSDRDWSSDVCSSDLLAPVSEKGFDAYLGLGGYFSDTGAKWNSSGIQNALQDRIGTDLLFPVYDSKIGRASCRERV